MRSRTGCQTCRNRKLKCDETKPICGQCRKASRQCVPSAGVIFRHQQNASMNAAEEDGGHIDDAPKLGAFYSYRNTFDDSNVWVEVPKKVTFVCIADPFNMEASPTPESSPNESATQNSSDDTIVGSSHSLAALADDIADPTSTVAWHTGLQSIEGVLPVGLDTLSTAAVNDQYFSNTFRAPMTPIDCRNTMSPASLSSANNINFILNHSGSSTSPSVERSITPAYHHISSSTLSYTAIMKNSAEVVSEHETAFLLRQFAENTGEWMDLFDLGAYFAQTVPIEAVQNPLLKNAACANAAKQIARIRGKGDAAKRAQMNYPEGDKVDWMYQATQYYDLAISLLMKELSLHDEQATTDPEWETTAGSPSQRRMSHPESKSSNDQTLAAAAILCVYEFLDNTSDGWSQHLSGTKSLFDLADKEELMPLELQNQSPLVPNSFTLSQRLQPSKGRKATFWNFARQDFLAAFINETPTRLDTADLGMWRAAGLLLDHQGFVIPSNAQENANDGYITPVQSGMREDMIANALIWLLSKIINYAAAGDSIDHVFPQDRTSPNGVLGINQMTLLERWLELEKELDIWYKGLPKTFEPYARLKHTAGPPDSPLQEIWYGMPMCAATMQSYHMARAILLGNRPQESTVRRSTLAERLHSYRTIESQVRCHSNEICGIALGRPPPTVRVHMVQPLFVAGQCLIGDYERRLIISQLRAIEEDLGWATEYRVQQLIREWESKELP